MQQTMQQTTNTYVPRVLNSQSSSTRIASDGLPRYDARRKEIVITASAKAVSVDQLIFVRHTRYLSDNDRKFSWNLSTIINQILRYIRFSRENQTYKNKVKREPFALTEQDFFSLHSLSTLPRVHYRNAWQVRKYLDNHPDIDRFLLKAWPNLIEQFGQNVEVVLELLHYVEEKADPELVAWIQCPDDVDSGIEKLDAFVDNWFLDHMGELSGRFNFNLEFK